MVLLRRILNWVEDRTGVEHALGPVLKHIVPRTGWGYVFGSATLVAFLIQLVTGVVLATAYVPSADQAYSSLTFIMDQATLGRLLRGMHYFGASAMVILIGIHAIRVFLSGSFKFPREVNWLIGVGLLLLTLGIAFTGQLLRWDQNAVWSVVVGAEQAGRVPLIGRALAHFLFGGGFLGGATLSRFFALHVFVLPALILGLIGLHLFLVIRNGISEPPRAGDPVDPATYRQRYRDLLKRDGVPFWPVAAWRDVAFGAFVIVAVVLLAAIVGPPPLGKPPDPTIVDAYPRPDWYFLWYFALLAMLPHGAESTIMVLAPLTLVGILIAIPLLFSRGERSLRRRPWAVAAVAFAILSTTILTIAGYRAHWSPDFSAQPLPPEVVGATAGPVYRGALVFHRRGCAYCHQVEGYGGRRGPDLSTIADRLTAEQMIVRIMNGGYNMPAFAGNITPTELDDLIEFLRSRNTSGIARVLSPGEPTAATPNDTAVSPARPSGHSDGAQSPARQPR